MLRSVLFVDPPAFCTSLEGLVAPALRTRPLAVAPPGADRAVILALSAEARMAGVERGMPVRKAQRLCPDLIVLPPNPRLYARASRALHEILRIYAPTIEPRGYGHAFLDLTGTGRLFGPPQDVAAHIRREAHARLGLSVSVGVASNKLVSQAAIRADRRTDGRVDGPGTRAAGGGGQQSSELLYVPAGDERGFLAPHPLEVLPELHPRMRVRLEDYQLDLIGEVAAIPESALCAVFGREGRMLRARAQGIDPRPVLPPERQAEFRVAHALTTDTNDIGVLHPMLRMMSERLGHRLRHRGLTAGRLRLDATYADYTTAGRSVSLSAGMLDTELWNAACRAFTLANTKRLAVRAVALMLDRLMEAEAQLELWAIETAVRRYGGMSEPRHPAQYEVGRASQGTAECEEGTPAVPLQQAIDQIHHRWGMRGISRGVARPPAHLATSAGSAGYRPARVEPPCGPVGCPDDPSSGHASLS